MTEKEQFKLNLTGYHVKIDSVGDTNSVQLLLWYKNITSWIYLENRFNDYYRNVKRCSQKWMRIQVTWIVHSFRATCTGPRVQFMTWTWQTLFICLLLKALNVGPRINYMRKSILIKLPYIYSSCISGSGRTFTMWSRRHTAVSLSQLVLKRKLHWMKKTISILLQVVTIT